MESCLVWAEPELALEELGVKSRLSSLLDALPLAYSFSWFICIKTLQTGFLRFDTCIGREMASPPHLCIAKVGKRREQILLLL